PRPLREGRNEPENTGAGPATWRGRTPRDPDAGGGDPRGGVGRDRRHRLGDGRAADGGVDRGPLAERQAAQPGDRRPWWATLPRPAPPHRGVPDLWLRRDRQPADGQQFRVRGDPASDAVHGSIFRPAREPLGRGGNAGKPRQERRRRPLPGPIPIPGPVQGGHPVDPRPVFGRRDERHGQSLLEGLIAPIRPFPRLLLASVSKWPTSGISISSWAIASPRPR